MTAKKTESAPKKRGRGRPSKYNDDIAEKICNLIEEGHSERQIAAMDGMPSTRTIWQWKEDYPEFLRRSARAREASAEKFDDERTERAAWLMGQVEHYAGIGLDMPKGIVEGTKVVMQELARSAALRDDSRFGDRKTVKVDAKADGAGLADVYAKIAEAVKGEQE